MQGTCHIFIMKNLYKNNLYKSNLYKRTQIVFFFFFRTWYKPFDQIFELQGLLERGWKRGDEEKKEKEMIFT